MDLTKAEDIKKRWQEYTEELYKKDLHDSDNHDDVITNLEPDILESEVKALQRTVKRREAKSKGEKERYTHLNAEFQRIRSKDKKAFLSDQCKEIEEKVEWEVLEISSRKLEIPMKHFMQKWAQLRTEIVWT